VPGLDENMMDEAHPTHLMGAYNLPTHSGIRGGRGAETNGEPISPWRGDQSDFMLSGTPKRAWAEMWGSTRLGEQTTFVYPLRNSWEGRSTKEKSQLAMASGSYDPPSQKFLRGLGMRLGVQLAMASRS
jgi:hypothetical protein